MKLFSLFKPKEISKKLEYMIVAGVIAGFIGLVVVTIGKSSIWFDEAFGAYLIGFNFFDIFKFTALDVHPPLYYWVLQLWTAFFGSSDIALRSMSTFFAVVALIAGYLFVRKAFGQKAALVMLPLVALSPILIRYAQEARMYTMVLAIGLTATYALYLLQQKSSRKLWVIYAVLVAAGMWTHYFTALVWLGHWAWRAFETYAKPLGKWRKAFFTREWVMTHVLAVVLFLPWLPWLIRQVLDVQTNGFWIPPVSPVTIPSYLSDVFLYQTAWQTSPWMTLVLGATVMLGAFLTIRVYKGLGKDSRKAYALLIASATVPVGLLLLMSMPPAQSTFIDRYILMAAICLVMVFGIAIALASKELYRTKFVLTALLVVASVVGIANVYHYGNYNTTTEQKSETRQLIQAIRDTQGAEGQPIIANTPWVYYEAAQYGNDTNGVYFINQYVEYKYGSLEMLRQSDRGKIKDLDAFLVEHPIVWYIGRPGDAEIDPPAGNVEAVQSIRISDEITGKPAYQAVQYRVISE